MADMLLGIITSRGHDANYASSGGEIAFPCPLCDDHKPRLYVNRKTLKWTCFNCQEAGFAERFLTDVLLIDPIMAGRVKGQLLGDTPIIHSIKAVMKAEAAVSPMEWPPFTMSLDSTSNEVQEPYWVYLHNRGVRVEQVVHYGIRYCAVGKYGGRVVVPVTLDGVLRGWVARLIRPAVETEQKVLTPPGMKSSLILFGLDHIKGETCVLVEGVFDAMAFPDGVAVATLGAKLSPIQRDLLRRHGIKHVILMFDNDEAGWKGTRRAASELVAAGFEVEVAMLPEGTDPGSSDIVALERAIGNAFPVNGVRSVSNIKRQMNTAIKAQQGEEGCPTQT